MSERDAPDSPPDPNSSIMGMDDRSQQPPQHLLVGIGASAGGLTALQRFFDHMPATSGMSFVVIVHLSADHESQLAMLIQNHTAMTVVAVTETVSIAPNHVYIIPPAKHLVMVDGAIHLSKPERERGRRAPIDLFFRTLAESHAHNAAAIVLSGAGEDGALGLTRVKEFGGLTIVQDPEEAEYDSMPRSAIGTGLVDFVLPVIQMPDRLLATQQSLITDPPAAGTAADIAMGTLRSIISILRARTGHDFSHYKPNTLLRRIARRLSINHLKTIEDYPPLLRDQPGEIQALLRDVLISVTNFFRDPNAFLALEKIIPELFAGKGPADQVRVWVAACATGDEAYSIAILLSEYAEQIQNPPSVQVFASDIDEDAITVAREGLFLETIANDLSPERLERWFTPELGRYRVRGKLRDRVVFTVHNVLRDPPFSRLDLITCRNLLIYLDRAAQQQVLMLFHFALRPKGYLFLGASESADEGGNLFTIVDKSNRLFQRHVGEIAPPVLPQVLSVNARQRPQELRTASAEQGRSLADLHQALLAPYGPASVLINNSHDIVHFSARATRWLQFNGVPSFNLLKVIHPAMRIDLRSALFAALENERRPEVRRIQIMDDDVVHHINLRVHPIRTPGWAAGLILVIFEEIQPLDEAILPARSSEDDNAVMRQLEAENLRLKEQIRAMIEQYETSAEELKASNEELQATAEEFRATTEELETSKEELQSVNEELSTVNNELKYKVDELSRSNGDLQNLLVATDIGTIFLDRSLRIKRYTPRIRDLFNIIPSDLLRPLAHVTHKLDYDRLPADATQVLEQLVPLEREVRTTTGQWHLLRILPYRTLEDRIDGVVLTFVEITTRKQTEEALRRNDERFRRLYEFVRDYAIFSTDPAGLVVDWNEGAQRIFGYAPDEIIGRPMDILFTPEDQATGAPEQERRSAMIKGSTEDERWHLRRGGVRFYVSGVTTALYNEVGEVRGFLKIGRDLTERKQAEDRLQQEYEKLEQHVVERTADLVAVNNSLQQEMLERRRIEKERAELLHQVITAQEEERRRISRELHDQAGQHLTALRLLLSNVMDSTSRSKRIAASLKQAHALASTLDEELHQLAMELRPAALDDLGLEDALSYYVDEWRSRTKIEVDLHMQGLAVQRFAPQLETTVYRVVQEALTNVLKHAAAQRVSVIVERRQHELIVIVEDDGRGFDVDARIAGLVRERRLGLLGMRERVEQVSGALTLESTPGQGTTLIIRIPLGARLARGGEPDGEEQAAGPSQ